jgi:hypothetical protein
MNDGPGGADFYIGSLFIFLLVWASRAEDDTSNVVLMSHLKKDLLPAQKHLFLSRVR